MNMRLTRTLATSPWFLIVLLVGGIGIRGGWAQEPAPSTFQPGLFQKTNPNYLNRNPFYFEGKVTWELLGIDQPKDAWEFLQRGLHRQDDLEDSDGAIADYRQALSMNSLDNGTCQLVTSVPASNLNPPPCMIIVRQRLAYITKEDDPQESIRLLREVLKIDPLRLGINQLIGDIYIEEAAAATTDADRKTAYQNALDAFKAELALSPVTPLTIQLTGDEANNSHTHWAMAEVYEKLGMEIEAAVSLQNYLKASKWHSDVYPWRIQLAQKKLTQLQGKKAEPAGSDAMPQRSH